MSATCLGLLAYGQSGDSDVSARGGGAAYDLSWYTIDGGGVMFSAAGDYELSGTIGQADAGGPMVGPPESGYELTGGFWFRIPLGDCEDDGDVDLNDLEAFEDCLPGPDPTSLDDDCRCFDVNRNGAVDLADLATIQRTFTSQ